jgi:uncharacterized protein (DUF2235 family)
MKKFWRWRMAKNVVVCCDGTANQFSVDRTNIVKLFFTLKQDDERQVAFYHPGIGTMEPPGALTPLRRRVARLLQQAVGWGLENDIRDAYAFVMNNFTEGDPSSFSASAAAPTPFARSLRSCTCMG